jgi:hypothetical protein
MTAVLHIDFETASEADLPVVGLDNYSRHPSTKVHCLGFVFGGEEVSLIADISSALTDCPELFEHIERGGEVVAHNAPFELAIWNNVCVPKYGWPRLKPEQMRCTMAQCYAMGLPASLEKAAAALGIEETKDMAGSRVMMQLARPNPDGELWVYSHNPEKFERLFDYCRQDVEVERELDKRLMKLSPKEREVWLLDRKINERGIRVDVSAINSAIWLVNAEKQRLDAEMLSVTDGEVARCTEVQALVKWVKKQGVALESVGKANVLDALNTTSLPVNVREALNIRREAAKSSTAKLAAMRDRAGRDTHRVRDSFQYHGATTGRWAHRGVQPGNLPRPRPDVKQDHIEDIIKNIADRDYIDIYYGPVMAAMADCVRGMITADKGCELIAVDFSAVEARVLAWLAGEEKVLDIFRTHGKIYEHAAAGIYGKPIDAVTKEERQIGKVACFGPQTQVVTSNGIKAIMEVLPNDLLWDGVEWVNHSGVIEKGVKPVVNVDGIEVTPDHLILVGQTWTQAQQLATSESTLSQALETGSANLPSWVSSVLGKARATPISFGCNARVARPRTWSTITASAKEAARGAIRALKRARGVGEKTIGLTPTFARTMPIADAYSIAFPHAFSVAKIQTTANTATTEAGAFGFILNGQKTAAPFWRFWSRLTDGTIPAWNWIASTLMWVINQATCVSSHEKKTLLTNAELPICKTRSENLRPVFDILNAGPRHRFTIVTSRGALIAHNCLALGFGGGVGAFQSMARVYGVNVDDQRADDIKTKWRASHPKIVQYWRELETAAIDAIDVDTTTFAGHPGREVALRKEGSFLWCKLPSGRVLCYPYPMIRQTPTPWGEPRSALHYHAVSLGNHWEETSTYGGSLAENVTQAVARDLLAEAMLRLEAAGHQIVMHVHDEIVVEVSREAPADTLKKIEKIVATPPSWAKDLPLAAEGWRGFRYRK